MGYFKLVGVLSYSSNFSLYGCLPRASGGISHGFINGCEACGSAELLFPTDSCEVSDQGWGPAGIAASQAIIEAPHHSSSFPVRFRGPGFPPGESKEAAAGGWELTLSWDQVSAAPRSAPSKKSRSEAADAQSQEVGSCHRNASLFKTGFILCTGYFSL